MPSPATLAPRSSPTEIPAASAQPSGRVLPPDEAWAAVRAALGSPIPVVRPTWLPTSVDQTRADLRELVADPSAPRYTIVYSASGGAEILFTLGPTPRIGEGESGVSGIKVRNVNAVVGLASWLWADPAKPGLRRVRWEEGSHVLQIASRQFTGDELLRIAWSLDQTGAPQLANPYTPVKNGVCAKVGAPPEETVRNLIGLIGRGDRHAVLDCWSLEVISDWGPLGGSVWAQLPRARAFHMDNVWDFGGRFIVQAGWTFESDPGGAWNQSPVNFFLMGLEDGSWRAHSAWTARIGPLP